MVPILCKLKFKPQYIAYKGFADFGRKRYRIGWSITATLLIILQTHLVLEILCGNILVFGLFLSFVCLKREIDQHAKTEIYCTGFSVAYFHVILCKTFPSTTSLRSLSLSLSLSQCPLLSSSLKSNLSCAPRLNQRGKSA